MQKIKNFFKNMNILAIWYFTLLLNFLAYLIFLFFDKEIYPNLAFVLSCFILFILLIASFLQWKVLLKKIVNHFDYIKWYLKKINIYWSLVLIFIVPKIFEALFVGSAPTTAAYHWITFIGYLIYIIVPIWIFSIIYYVFLKVLVFIINKFMK